MRIILLFLVAVSILSACVTLDPSSTEAPTQALLPFQTRTPSSAARQDFSTPVRRTTPQPSPTPLVHIIQGGDTLLGISIRYGVSLEDLLIANTGIDPGFLSIDQEIIIPGPEGEPVGVLLPSPTPMLVEIGRPQCFRAAPDNLVCITEISNDTGEMIEGMTVSFEIIEAGIEVGKYAVFGPLNLLAPGTSMPFMIRIAGWEGEVPGVSVNGEYVQLFGEVMLEESSDYAAHRLRVLGVAYDATGFPVGYALWEDEITGEFSNIPFDITVFSLGGRIFKTDVFAEAQGFDPE
jgi:LysM repeat protein